MRKRMFSVYWKPSRHSLRVHAAFWGVTAGCVLFAMWHQPMFASTIASHWTALALSALPGVAAVALIVWVCRQADSDTSLSETAAAAASQVIPLAPSGWFPLPVSSPWSQLERAIPAQPSAGRDIAYRLCASVSVRRAHTTGSHSIRRHVVRRVRALPFPPQDL